MAKSSAYGEDVFEDVQPYFMHVSARYLELTRRKLALSRLPRIPLSAEDETGRYGTSKAVIAPLIDFWLDQYDWRAQEQFLNNILPQFRAHIQIDSITDTDGEDARKTRVHFVHKRCPRDNAVPLLLCHGWPGGFIEFAKIIDVLCDPDAFVLGGVSSTPPPLAFHVVVPSIPGFGFSDGSSRQDFGLEDTARVFDRLMKLLGGFAICRMLALNHGDSCLAVHAVSPETPPPSFRHAPMAALKYQAARWMSAHVPPLSFGYNADDTRPSKSQEQPSISNLLVQRHQTHSYSLCDSPIGLLSVMLDALQPPPLIIPPRPDAFPASHNDTQVRTAPISTAHPATNQLETIRESIGSVEPVAMMTAPIWSPQDILNFTMVHWLPGPEAGLRWLAQVQREADTGHGEMLWERRSATPLGFSVFGRLSGALCGGDVSTENETTAVKRKGQRGCGAALTALMNGWWTALPSRWSSWTHVGGKPAAVSAAAEEGGRGSTIETSRARAIPPMWASAYHDVVWVRRHHDSGIPRQLRLPAWEVPDQLAVDIRECFADMILRGKFIIGS